MYFEVLYLYGNDSFNELKDESHERKISKLETHTFDGIKGQHAFLQFNHVHLPVGTLRRFVCQNLRTSGQVQFSQHKDK